MTSTKRVRQWRLDNPIADCLHRNKSHAKQRGIEWHIDELQWWVFCLATNYHKLKGIGANDLSLDRIQAWRGYEFDNIQILTLSQNTLKKMKVDAKEKMKNRKSNKEPGDPF